MARMGPASFSNPMVASTLAILAILSACGGGGGGGTPLASIPPPPTATPSPTPTPIPPPPSGIPTPPPPPAHNLIAPAQTASPETPTATGGASFDSPAAGTIFPLMITAVGPAFSGDSATVNAGALLQAGAGQLSLTLNNSELGVNGVRPNSYPYNQNFYAPDGRPVIALLGADDNLDYTRYGYWTVPTAVNPYYDRAGGAWMGGYATPPSQIPVTGSATYNGRLVGLASSYPTCGCDDFEEFTGNVQMSADFGSRELSGSMTNLRFTDSMSSFDLIPLNDIGFGAAINPAQNMFTGTTWALTVPFNPHPTFSYAVNAGATGSISGRFFGPSAQEAGGVWTLSDGLHRLMGSFGVTRTGP